MCFGEGMISHFTWKPALQLQVAIRTEIMSAFGYLKGKKKPNQNLKNEPLFGYNYPKEMGSKMGEGGAGLNLAEVCGTSLHLQPCCCLSHAGAWDPKLPEQAALWSGRAWSMERRKNEIDLGERKCDSSSPNVTERGQAHIATFISTLSLAEMRRISPVCAAIPFFFFFPFLF